MRPYNFRPIVISVLILCFLSSCNQALSIEEGGGSIDTESNIVYPFKIEENMPFSDVENSGTPYPFGVDIKSPEVVDEFETPPLFQNTQTPPPLQEGFGIIYGTLISLSDNLTIPQVTLIAAEKVYLEGSEGYVISFREKSSPRGDTNDYGQFIIDSILPGDYVLMLVTPGGSFLGLNEDQEEIHVAVEVNSIINIGDVLINWP